jgi:AraC family transcriptional regulator of adaptative response / DNA-3-methyladenine glycosylase II
MDRARPCIGVGARHLDRLFQKHLGASPSQVARTARVQRAKRLLDETALPMIEVAERAGFASLRLFNAVFADVYGADAKRRAPTARQSGLGLPKRKGPP